MSLDGVPASACANLWQKRLLMLLNAISAGCNPCSLPYFCNCSQWLSQSQGCWRKAYRGEGVQSFVCWGFSSIGIQHDCELLPTKTNQKQKKTSSFIFLVLISSFVIIFGCPSAWPLQHCYDSGLLH